MIKKVFATLLIMSLCFTFLAIPAFAAMNFKRLSGLDRFKTAKAIAEEYNAGVVNSVVLVPGNSFANALPAGVLAYQKSAPILLVDDTASETKEAFAYITAHLNKSGTVYLVGDSNIIGSDFTAKLNSLGYSNVVSIAGHDKYDTGCLIARQLNVSAGTPVVISSGENFPDALAISGYAAGNKNPIILVKPDSISEESLNYIKSIKPETIYITGGTGAVSSIVESEIKNAATNANIQRLAGKDRFETAAKINDHFSPGNVSDIYVTSGLNFPDALAGSVLAAKKHGAIILVDPENTLVPDSETGFLKKYSSSGQTPALSIFGGTGVVADDLATNVSNLLQGKEQVALTLTTDYFIPTVNKTYVFDDGYSYKWSTNDNNHNEYHRSIYLNSVSMVDSNSYAVENGQVLWTAFHHLGGSPIYVMSGRFVELTSAVPGESWESSWQAQNRHGELSTGHVKKTFVGWEKLSIMGQTVTTAHLHVIDKGSYYGDQLFNLEYDQWLVKGKGIVRETDTHFWNVGHDHLRTLVDIK